MKSLSQIHNKIAVLSGGDIINDASIKVGCVAEILKNMIHPTIMLLRPPHKLIFRLSGFSVDTLQNQQIPFEFLLRYPDHTTAWNIKCSAAAELFFQESFFSFHVTERTVECWVSFRPTRDITFRGAHLEFDPEVIKEFFKLHIPTQVIGTAGSPG